MLHVADLYRLVDWQLHHMDKVNGEVLNAGGGLESSASLQELTKICQEVTGKTIPIKVVPENRTADIRLYVTDNSKVTALTGWKPQIGIKQIVEEITAWLAENEKDLAPILK
jgi:CDP-paratose 2-epimerase